MLGPLENTWKHNSCNGMLALSSTASLSLSYFLSFLLKWNWNVAAFNIVWLWQTQRGTFQNLDDSLPFEIDSLTKVF